MVRVPGSSCDHDQDVCDRDRRRDQDRDMGVPGYPLNQDSDVENRNELRNQDHDTWDHDRDSGVATDRVNVSRTCVITIDFVVMITGHGILHWIT